MPRSGRPTSSRPRPSLLYRAVVAGSLPLWLPWVAVHPRLRGGLGERFGRPRDPLPERPVWLHGASAGDIVALLPIAALLRRCGCEVVFSTWTRTGELIGRQRCPPGVRVLRAPVDLRGPVHRLLARLRPRLLVLECLEMWPQLIAACAAGGVPVAVINGRLSEQSLRRYRRARSLFAPCFASLAYVSALTDADAARFAAAGTSPARIEVRSSSKHAGLQVRAVPPVRPARVVLGSIHRDEESALLPWLARLRSERAAAVVVAPRYPGRARGLRRALRRLAVPAELTSCGAVAPEAVEVLDVMGQLPGRYQGASVAFVGGSLAPRGGHNLVEPAACGVPVLFGPSVEHCAVEASALRAAGAGWEVRGQDDLWRRGIELIDDPDRWQRASGAALGVAAMLGETAAPIAGRLVELAR